MDSFAMDSPKRDAEMKEMMIKRTANRTGRFPSKRRKKQTRAQSIARTGTIKPPANPIANGIRINALSGKNSIRMLTKR